MVVTGPFLAVDWGTTNRRIYRIDDGRVVRTERDARGVTSMAAADYPEEIATIRATFGDLPVLLAGMVGSTIGWRTAPYVAAPTSLVDLAASLLQIDDRTAIVPGVRTATDVMRGEEVQLLGAVAAGLAPGDALLCQPGTHCKWAEMAGGAIRDFSTSMTGELFALLTKASVLAPLLAGQVGPGTPFRQGVTEGATRDLARSLFGVRAAHLLGSREDADAASYASGLLIGADVAARLDRIGNRPVHILADQALGSLYAETLAMLGGRPTVIDSHASFTAGISTLAELA